MAHTNLNSLVEFCEKHNIKYKVKRREVIEAAIVRFFHDGKKIEQSDMGCFGNWNFGDPVCLDCWHEADCHIASLGYPKPKSKPAPPVKAAKKVGKKK